MNNYRRPLIAVLLLLMLSTTALKAQWQSQQELSAKMQLYGIANPSAMLFVHFDKTIYNNNETVWFTGYLLKGGLEELAKHEVMSVALIRDLDSLIIKQDKYLMGNGFSYGSMTLPDSILTGNYHFQVTTNRVKQGKPDACFMQPILIKTNNDPAFSASIKILEAGAAGKKPNQLVVAVTSTDGRFLPKPAEVSYKYGNLYKKAMTNISGELLFSLPEQPGVADPNVYATVKYNNHSSFVNIPVPISKRIAKVKFYPEGGNLIEGIPCKVAWEVKDQQGTASALKAVLLKDGKVINNLTTNNYGTGRFTITPEHNSTYSVKLMHPDFDDSNYNLPPALGDGVGLAVKDAAATDTLTITMQSKVPQKLALRIHDFVTTYWYKELDLSTASKTLKISLKDMPKGLKTVTLFDSLNRPLGECMIFAHYNVEKKVLISTDQPIYGQRQKVSLKLKMNGTDTLGLVSVACVQDNRISVTLNNDIETYVYLKNELNELPVSPGIIGYRDKNYVESVLLTKGWRRYTWQDIMRTTASDTLQHYDDLTYAIHIKKANKPLDSAIRIAIIRDATMAIDSTDNTGILKFKNESMLIEYGKKMRVFVSDPKRVSDYNIKSYDPYVDLNKKYIQSIGYKRSIIPTPIQNNRDLLLKNNERVIRLKEVTISKGKPINYVGPNECGDYVCVYNVLNCINHPANQGVERPVPGKRYLNNYGGTAVYKRCDEQDHFVIQIPAIYTRKEFYINDFSQPQEPAFVSTLYWNHGVILDSKDKELSFYTGDITGKFRIVVQGMTNNDLIYGEQFFEVKAKPLNSTP